MKRGIFLLFVTVFLISSVLAFDLDINSDDFNVNEGEEIFLLTILNISAGEVLPVNYFELVIGNEILCRFDTDSSAFFGCTDLNISALKNGNFTNGNLSGQFNSTNYSFGFGNGFGNDLGNESFIYNISLNSSVLGEGIFTTRFRARIDNINFDYHGSNLSVINSVYVTDLLSSDLCLVEGENENVFAEINGSIKEVFVSVGRNGNFRNISLGESGEGVYTREIENVSNGILEWQFFVKSIANEYTFGNLNSIVVNNKTALEVIPPNPDGLNGWYLIEPLFVLKSESGVNISYRWNGEYHNYTSSFGLEGAPNNGNLTGGIHTLTYWSDLCNEVNQNKTFKFDFTNPFITDIKPENESVVFNNPKPRIEALLDEIYQSNSGINNASILMSVNNVLLNSSQLVIINQGIDRLIRYDPSSNLPDGQNNVSVYGKDNSGRESSLNWSFYINNSVGALNLSVFTPQNGILNTRKVLFNLTTNDYAEKIFYINHDDLKPKEKILCKNCNSYGNLVKRSQTLNEGNNNLTLIAINGFGIEVRQNISLYVDSKKPKIIGTEPRKGKVVNGSLFSVKYTESDLQSITLHFNPNISLIGCPSGESEVCKTSLNLSAFDGTQITYYFVLKDKINSMSSKNVSVFVDTTYPVINLTKPVDVNQTKKVEFNITISERVDLEYYDLNDSGARWKRLCNDCNEYGTAKNKTVNFKNGEHNLIIRARDEAGNADVKEIMFNVN